MHPERTHLPLTDNLLKHTHLILSDNLLTHSLFPTYTICLLPSRRNGGKEELKFNQYNLKIVHCNHSWWVCTSYKVHLKSSITACLTCVSLWWVSMAGRQPRRPLMGGTGSNRVVRVALSPTEVGGPRAFPWQRWYLLSHQGWLLEGWCLEVLPLLAGAPLLGDGWYQAGPACQWKHLQNKREYIH